MSRRSSLSVDGSPLRFRAGETLLAALLRAGLHPTGGGCLCCAGDCSHCLVTVDGVGYVRSCQVAAAEGMSVSTDHAAGGYPPLPLEVTTPGSAAEGVVSRTRRCDVVVIGQGDAGREAADRARARGWVVLAFDAISGQEVIGIYPGPLVVVRTREGMLRVEPSEEIVIATGAAEIQPVAPGNDLLGIVTTRAAEALASAGVDLGKIVAVGRPPVGPSVQAVDGWPRRFDGRGRVEAVVVRDDAGVERRHECDTVSVGLGLYPRDVLARMATGVAGAIRVSVVGDAGLPATPPPCPEQGRVCACSDVQVEDLDSVWQRGFREMELLKRATLAGTGACQGSACIPYLRSFLADRGGELQAPFTARPLSRPLTVGEVAAGAHHHATPRTALDREHRDAGARMERAGGWYRPWSYGDPAAECRAVREAVSIGDVSTLGKMRVSGPDALELLERLYPTRVATIRPGHSRYALLLDDRGYVLDDGLICHERTDDGASRYFLTFTSGGATLAELWVRDWAESWELDVRLMNQTMSLGAIAVTGPRAAELLHHAGASQLPPFGGHLQVTVAGVSCRVLRLSFTGELSYELHHNTEDSVALWRALLERGEAMGCRPHGLDALLRLRLEKGHIIVGQDTDFDSTPRRIAHEWAISPGKQEFVGSDSIRRTDRVPLDRRLVGLQMDGEAPIEGAVIWTGEDYAGYVTSAATSTTVGAAVMLGWVRTLDDAGTLPELVTIGGRPARRVPLPFYDPEGRRARVDVGVPIVAQDGPPAPADRTEAEPIGGLPLRRVAFTRIVATPSALDAVQAALPKDTILLRTAGDEALVLGAVSADAVDDAHAIVEPETGYAAARIPAAEAAAVLEINCEWKLPATRPAFAQGSVADLPVKLWLEEDWVLIIVPAPFARDLEARLAARAAAGGRP